LDDPKLEESVRKGLEFLGLHGLTPFKPKPNEIVHGSGIEGKVPIYIQISKAGNLVAAFHDKDLSVIGMPLDYGKKAKKLGPDKSGWGVMI